MDLVTIPVGNGVLPRVPDGVATGVFLDPITAGGLRAAGPDGLVFLSPYAGDDGELFTVGVLAVIEDLWVGEVYVGQPPERQGALFAQVRGRSRAKAAGFSLRRRLVVAENVKPIDLTKLRQAGYPTIAGDGWLASSGTTDQQLGGRIEVSIMGTALEDSREVSVTASLADVVSPYQAHTIEHGICRSLNQYCLCSPRTLAKAIKAEAKELRASVELGFRYGLPEVFGVTQTGACGNPLTNLVRFYLARELAERLKEGDPIVESLARARRKTLSELVETLEVDMSAGLRVVQGLHRGMRHDDTPLDIKKLAEVLLRFPPDPWH